MSFDTVCPHVPAMHPLSAKPSPHTFQAAGRAQRPDNKVCRYRQEVPAREQHPHRAVPPYHGAVQGPDAPSTTRTLPPQLLCPCLGFFFEASCAKHRWSLWGCTVASADRVQWAYAGGSPLCTTPLDTFRVQLVNPHAVAWAEAQRCSGLAGCFLNKQSPSCAKDGTSRIGLQGIPGGGLRHCT